MRHIWMSSHSHTEIRRTPGRLVTTKEKLESVHQRIRAIKRNTTKEEDHGSGGAIKENQLYMSKRIRNSKRRIRVNVVVGVVCSRQSIYREKLIEMIDKKEITV